MAAKIQRYGVIPRIGVESATIAFRKKPMGDYVLFKDHVERISSLKKEVERLEKRIKFLENLTHG
jgi:chaperonin cofactor prefoldin